jgi:phosphatidylserine decarboxylase
VAIALFFRNPERIPPTDEGLLVSPADGTVVEIQEGIDSANLPGVTLTRVSIFMSIFSVHINRAPISGNVKRITHSPGRFLDARDKNASSENERSSMLLAGKGDTIEVVQVAGKVARRICCWVREGDEIGRGERFGMIRFGSRLDVYMSEEYRITAKLGAKVRAGVTALAVREKPESTSSS